VVLDPFAGAFTTGLVAARHGRRAIGIELSRDYCDLAKDRVLEEDPDLPLFAPLENQGTLWD
jgi:DNA modification methylase